MPACFYLLREPAAGIESSLFASQEAGYVLLEGALPSSSTDFAEIARNGDQKDSSVLAGLTDVELLDLVFAHSKVIVL